MDVKEAGARGGQATAKKKDRKHFQTIGLKGSEKRWGTKIKIKPKKDDGK